MSTSHSLLYIIIVTLAALVHFQYSILRFGPHALLLRLVVIVVCCCNMLHRLLVCFDSRGNKTTKRDPCQVFLDTCKTQVHVSKNKAMLWLVLMKKGEKS